MAIAKMRKLEIIGLHKDKAGILSLLQKLGVVQLINIQETGSSVVIQPAHSGINLLEIEEVISYLSSFQEEAGFLSGMVQLKPTVYQKQLREIIAHFDYKGLLKELSGERNHLKILSQHKERLLQERQLLIPWRNLGIPLNQVRSTRNCGILLGVLSTRDYANLFRDCQKDKINLFCDIVHQDNSNTYLVIFYLKDEFECIEAVLKKQRFNFVTLTHPECTVKDRLLEINFEILAFDDQLGNAHDRIKSLARERFNLMVLCDYLANMQNVDNSENNLSKQEFTFYLSGWIRARDTELLQRTLNVKFRDLAVFISEPDSQEAPVDLENNRILQPFEFITKIYGLPKYNELDPTPFLAPFFFLYFGFCVSDAGYGLILISLCWFILKKIRMGPQGTKFFRLFLFCGISTVVVGALTGSWFGNLIEILSQSHNIFLPLKKMKDSIIFLDPLKEPTKLLGIALGFGVTQVWFGNIVAAIGNIKNKRYLDVLLDQVSMLTFLFGLTGLGLIFLKLLHKESLVLFKYAALSGAIALFLTQGRSEKGIGAKLFFGAYNLYNNLSGYLSDILSYSRLWALGLVTGVMANTINLISIQFSQIFISVVPFVSKVSFIKIAVSSLILVIIFVLGHAVSFFMTLLGAFVHPLRLQFVEFFSKFFKPGGNVFRPFKIESKYINIG